MPYRPLELDPLGESIAIKFLNYLPLEALLTSMNLPFSSNEWTALEKELIIAYLNGISVLFGVGRKFKCVAASLNFRKYNI